MPWERSFTVKLWRCDRLRWRVQTDKQVLHQKWKMTVRKEKRYLRFCALTSFDWLIFLQHISRKDCDTTVALHYVQHWFLTRVQEGIFPPFWLGTLVWNITGYLFLVFLDTVFRWWVTTNWSEKVDLKQLQRHHTKHELSNMLTKLTVFYPSINSKHYVYFYKEETNWGSICGAWFISLTCASWQET